MTADSLAARAVVTAMPSRIRPRSPKVLRGPRRETSTPE